MATQAGRGKPGAGAKFLFADAVSLSTLVRVVASPDIKDFHEMDGVAEIRTRVTGFFAFPRPKAGRIGQATPRPREISEKPV